MMPFTLPPPIHFRCFQIEHYCGRLAEARTTKELHFIITTLHNLIR